MLREHHHKDRKDHKVLRQKVSRETLETPLKVHKVHKALKGLKVNLVQQDPHSKETDVQQDL